LGDCEPLDRRHGDVRRRATEHRKQDVGPQFERTSDHVAVRERALSQNASFELDTSSVKPPHPAWSQSPADWPAPGPNPTRSRNRGQEAALPTTRTDSGPDAFPLGTGDSSSTAVSGPAAPASASGAGTGASAARC